MKLKEELVKRLREGDCTLVADHSKPELMCKVLREAFPKDASSYDDYTNKDYFFKMDDDIYEWDYANIINETKGELIPLADFFESEQPYKPKTAEERDQLVKELQEMDFKKELPSELDCLGGAEILEAEKVLLRLLRMRDVYRQGWNPNKSTFSYRNNEAYLTNFSFQGSEVLNLFLENFREELESVKYLIS